MIIVYPPTIDFEWMVQRPQQLMKEFAKLGHTVYYCQQHQVKGKRSELILPNLWLVWDIALLPKPIDILWIGNPPLWNTVNNYQAKMVVYDCCDDFHEFWGKMEDSLTQRADVVITTAQRLVERKSAEKPGKVFLVPNGVDVDVFKYEEIPIKMNRRLGYVGALADWVDWDLIKYCATHLTGWEIALIGPEFHKVPNEIKHHGNIKLYGLKPYKELPMWIRNLDVCTVPFKINKITRATNPIKMYEYLALGKPVVTTDMDEIRRYADVVSIAKTHEEFVQKVLEEAATNSPAKEKKRVERIQAETWASRAKNALDIINGISIPSQNNSSISPQK